MSGLAGLPRHRAPRLSPEEERELAVKVARHPALRGKRAGNLFFVSDAAAISAAVAAADIIFVSVNTPTKTFGVGAGVASNLKHLELAARSIAATVRAAASAPPPRARRCRRHRRRRAQRPRRPPRPRPPRPPQSLCPRATP